MSHVVFSHPLHTSCSNTDLMRFQPTVLLFFIRGRNQTWCRHIGKLYYYYSKLVNLWVHLNSNRATDSQFVPPGGQSELIHHADSISIVTSLSKSLYCVTITAFMSVLFQTHCPQIQYSSSITSGWVLWISSGSKPLWIDLNARCYWKFKPV